mgnify:CR=1 FL=1
MKTAPLTPDDLRGVFAVPPAPPRHRPAAHRLRRERPARPPHGGRRPHPIPLRRQRVPLSRHPRRVRGAARLDGRSRGGSLGDPQRRPVVRAGHGPGGPCCAGTASRRDGAALRRPRDAAGLEAGLREIADAAGVGLILYLKDEGNFGVDKDAGLDVVARLVDAGICVGIKYAVIRPDPAQDPYLESLLRRVDRRFVISGIGERPAAAHLKHFRLPGFTTGSGCLAPGLSNGLFGACGAADWTAAEALRSRFMPLEDKRDAWGPARVLHAAIDLAGVASTGPIPPFVSALGEGRGPSWLRWRAPFSPRRWNRARAAGPRIGAA